MLVAPDGTGDSPTIQDAINAASPGDTVLLADGVFTGEGNRDVRYFGKSVVVRSQSGNADSCVVDCEGSMASPHRGFAFDQFETRDARLEAITIRNGFAPDSGGLPNGGAILCSQSPPTIIDCTLSHSRALRWGGGVYINGYGEAQAPRLYRCCFLADSAVGSGGVSVERGTPDITACSFIANQANNGGGLLLDLTHPHMTLSDCVFIGNHASRGGAIYYGGGTSPWFDVEHCALSGNTAIWGGAFWYTSTHDGTSIVDCTVSGNSAPEGSCFLISQNAEIRVERTIIAFHSGGPTVTVQVGGSLDLACCDVFGNDGGDWVGLLRGQQGAEGNLCVDPQFCDRAGGDFALHDSSPCLPEGSAGCGTIGFHPAGCATAIHTVSADGSGEFATIQEAVDAVAEGDVIELADGVYSGAGNRDIELRGKAITIRSASGDAEACVVDCQGNWDDEHRGFLFTDGESSGSLVEDITVRHGTGS